MRSFQSLMKRLSIVVSSLESNAIAAVTTLETKVAKSRSQRDHATIAALKAISPVNVESQRRTRLLCEDHGAKSEDGDDKTKNDATCPWLSIPSRDR
ncbi:hypothetical protein Tco_1217233 [Tanacetum coccineum]